MDHQNTASQLTSFLSDMKQRLIDVLPDIVLAVAIVMVGWFVAWLGRRLVHRTLRRFSRRLHPGLAPPDWNEAPEARGVGEVAAAGVYWLILLVTLMAAIDVLGIAVLGKWVDALTAYIPKVIVALAVVFAGVIGARLAGSAVRSRTLGLPLSQAAGLSRLTQASILIAATLIAAGQLGLDVSLLINVFLITLAMTLGGAALAFGLGARDVMSNILAMHYVNKTFRVGQVVRMGSDQGRIVRTTTTAVFLEGSEGELAIPGRRFAETSCMLVNLEGNDGP